MTKVLVVVVVFAAAIGQAAAQPVNRPGPGGPANAARPPAAAPESQIDKLVAARLTQLGLQPAPICSDAVFLRRVYLDVIGTLPTADEARSFLLDKDPDKRAKLVDRLLAREEFAAYWAMKWSDLLRVKAEFPINLWPNAAQAYHRWVRTSIRQNMPYDRFARELLTASGSNFRAPQVNFYRAVQGRQPESIAAAVALTFMGARADKWPKERLAGMAAFFARVGYKATGEWKEEIVYFDVARAATQPATEAIFPDGTKATLAPDVDPRQVFADWLVDARNPWFARNAVNRVWAWLLGRGIIHEPDDIRPGNPPSNPELLAYLERELVAANFDLKHLYRLILTSKVYQSSAAASFSPAPAARSMLARPAPAATSRPAEIARPPADPPTRPAIPADRRDEAEANFACYALRQLDAEVLIDAICRITGVPDRYASMTPEPFTVVPDGERALDLPDGSITSPFLEMFGRPARDTGLESERNLRPSAKQRLHLLNSGHIQRKLDQSPALAALRSRNPTDAATTIYLTVLSRFPTEEELKVAEAYLRSAGRDGAIDLTWALINGAEFLHRH